MPILSLAIQFLVVRESEAPPISGVDFAGGKIVSRSSHFSFPGPAPHASSRKLIWSRECISTMAVAATPLQTELKHETKCHALPSGMLDGWTKVEVAKVEN